MAKTLEDVTRKVTFWRDNLRQNAGRSDAEGTDYGRDEARRMHRRAEDFQDVLDLLAEVVGPTAEPDADDEGTASRDWVSFVAQNEIGALPDDVANQAAPYAGHHSGGLIVLWGLTRDGRDVKCHASWGDDEFYVVHTYDSDYDPHLFPDGDPTEAVAEFRLAEDAIRAFLALVDRD